MFLRPLYQAEGLPSYFCHPRKKLDVACAGVRAAPSTINGRAACRDLACGDRRVYLDLSVRRVDCPRCGGVKREQLDWLADNPLYTKRFAFYVGRRCRETPSRRSPRNCICTGIPSRSWTRSTCRNSFAGPAAPPLGSSASTRSPSARATAIASWSATWSGGGRSGLVARTVPRRAWTSSSPGSAQEMPQNPLGRHGHVEGVPQIHPQGRACSPSHDHLRQVSYPEASGRGHGQGPEREYARLSGDRRRFIKGQRYTLLSVGRT